MSKTWSVDLPGKGITQLRAPFHGPDNLDQTEQFSKPSVSSSAVVRLSPVQREFWNNFQSRRDGQAIRSSAFTQALVGDGEARPSTMQRKSTVGLPKIVMK